MRLRAGPTGGRISAAAYAPSWRGADASLPKALSIYGSVSRAIKPSRQADDTHCPLGEGSERRAEAGHRNRGGGEAQQTACPPPTTWPRSGQRGLGATPAPGKGHKSFRWLLSTRDPAPSGHSASSSISSGKGSGQRPRQPGLSQNAKDMLLNRWLPTPETCLLRAATC